MSEIIVKTLEFPESIRTRPGMYIGALTDPTHILTELVDNAKDEALMGYASKCVVITQDTYCIVTDNGRGVPVYIKEDSGNTAAIDIWSSSHTGSKFDDAGDAATVGMNGIGSKATNALSESFIGYVNLNKKDLNSTDLPVHEWIRNQASNFINPVYVITFQRGILISEEVIDLSDVQESVLKTINEVGDDWGTSVYFEPDPTIWDSTVTNYNTDSLRVSMLYLDGKMNITVNGESAKPYSLTDRYASSNIIEVDDYPYFTIEGDASNDRGVVCRYLIQLGFAGEDFDQRCDGSVNTVRTPSGAHVNAIVRGIGRMMSTISEGILNPSDGYYGMRCFSLVMTNRALFDSQTKERLASIHEYNMNDLTASVYDDSMKLFDNSRAFRKLIKLQIDRIIEYKKQLGQLSVRDQVVSEIILGTDGRNNKIRNTKVHDCWTNDRSEAELFLVEGDSAAGSLLQARDSKTHAVMPLRGKSLNATSSSIERLLENEEFKSLFNVIGAGVHPYNVDISACRYGKVVITTDADADGAHIRALLLGAFGTHLPQLIESGLLYVATTPLYEQDGKFFMESERDLMDPKKHSIRNKGLGGMDPDDIAQFVFGDRRQLIQVTSEGLDYAIELVKDSDSKYDLAVAEGLVEDNK